MYILYVSRNLLEQVCTVYIRTLILPILQRARRILWFYGVLNRYVRNREIIYEP